LTYTHEGGTGAFDQASYDAAMANYQKNLDAYNAQQTQSQNPNAPVYGGASSQLSSIFGDTTAAAAPIGTRPSAPDRNAFYQSFPDSGWKATQTLTPEQQDILDKNNALSQGLLGTAQKGLSSVDALLANPTMDESRLPRTSTTPGEDYIAASTRMMQPGFDRQRSMFGTNMSLYGIPRSSEAYRAGDSDLSDAQNKAMLQAIQTGMASNLTARQQGIQEQTYAQDRPLNIVNALRTGSQVKNPNFVDVPQQATTQGADILGAVNNQANYNQGVYNAGTAAASSANQGLGNALSTFASLYAMNKLGAKKA
jgi:hypothetical protein